MVMGCGLPPCTKRRSAQKPQDTAVRLSPARRAWRARVGLLLEKPSWSGPGLGAVDPSGTTPQPGGSACLSFAFPL